MLRGLLFTAACIASIEATTAATAHASTRDFPVAIEVFDQTGSPVPMATVRTSEEGILHRVNHVTGRWRADALYLADGTRVPFRNRQTIDIEVSAPGYAPHRFTLRVRKRANTVRVTLSPIHMADDIEPIEDPVIPFGRSVPND